MNYLTELLAFMAWQQRHPLTPLLQSYWQWLMYFNNEAAVKGEDGLWYWPVAFNVPNTVLMKLLGLDTRFQVNAQRKHLIHHNRIHYTPHVHQKAGQYRMNPFNQAMAQVSIPVMSGVEKRLVWTQPLTNIPPESPQYINSINNKYTSLLCHTPTAAKATPGFNLLPQLTDEERAAIEAQYPHDKLARFEAMWRAREEKQKREG